MFNSFLQNFRLNGQEDLTFVVYYRKIKMEFHGKSVLREIPSNLSHMGKVQHLGTSLPFVLCSKKKWGTACLVWLKARTLY